MISQLGNWHWYITIKSSFYLDFTSFPINVFFLFQESIQDITLHLVLMFSQAAFSVTVSAKLQCLMITIIIAYCVPGTELSTLCILCNSILPKSLWGRCYCYYHLWKMKKLSQAARKLAQNYKDDKWRRWASNTSSLILEPVCYIAW